MQKKISLFFLISFFIFSCSVQMREGLIVKGELTSPKIFEDFEGMTAGDTVAPQGTELMFIKGTKAPSLGWSVSQGTHAANKWVVSVVTNGYKSKHALKYEWDNKNGVWLASAVWLNTPVVWKGAGQISFMIKSGKEYKFDISIAIRTAKGDQVSFTTPTPRVGGENEWKKVIIPFSKFKVPQWYKKEQGDPGISSLPKAPKIVSFGITPVWHSEGECLIDQIEYGKKTIKTIPLKMKKRKPWTNSTSFVCYYGSGSIEEMSQFDVAIIEGRNQSPQDIKKLHDSGTYAVSYVTVGEDDKLRKGDGQGPGGYASYYVDADMDGMPDKNKNWNSYYVNAGSPAWQKFIINGRVKEIIEKMGADGIFMDTVDTVEIYKDTEDGMVDLIRNIRKTYPNIKIVQNRGFSVLEKTLPYIDGVMYEDFSIDYDWENDSYSKADKPKLISTGIFAVKINELRKKKNILVFDLDYAEASQTNLVQFCYDRGWEYDFIPYVSTIMLDEVYPYHKPRTVRGSKKFKGEGEKAEIVGNKTRLEKLKQYEGIIKRNTNKKDLALVDNGTTIKADSAFANYDPIHIIDGYTNDTRLDWKYSSWASLELPVDHWVQIDLPTPKKLSKIVIYWALDNGTYYDSQEVQLQYFFQGYWKLLTTVTNSGMGKVHKSVFEVKTPEIGRQLRLFQPKGMGPKSRPNLMWIAEVEVY